MNAASCYFLIIPCRYSKVNYKPFDHFVKFVAIAIFVLAVTMLHSRFEIMSLFTIISLLRSETQVLKKKKFCSLFCSLVIFLIYSKSRWWLIASKWTARAQMNVENRMFRVELWMGLVNNNMGSRHFQRGCAI